MKADTPSPTPTPTQRLQLTHGATLVNGVASELESSNTSLDDRQHWGKARESTVKAAATSLFAFIPFDRLFIRGWYYHGSCDFVSFLFFIIRTADGYVTVQWALIGRAPLFTVINGELGSIRKLLLASCLSGLRRRWLVVHVSFERDQNACVRRLVSFVVKAAREG